MSSRRRSGDALRPRRAPRRASPLRAISMSSSADEHLPEHAARAALVIDDQDLHATRPLAAARLTCIDFDLAACGHCDLVAGRDDVAGRHRHHEDASSRLRRSASIVQPCAAHQPVGDGKAETGAARLGRVPGGEEARRISVETGAGVPNRELAALRPVAPRDPRPRPPCRPHRARWPAG